MRRILFLGRRLKPPQLCHLFFFALCLYSLVCMIVYTATSSKLFFSFERQFNRGEEEEVSATEAIAEQQETTIDIPSNACQENEQHGCCSPDVVMFRNFTDKLPEEHNVTTDGRFIPGLFINQQLFLLGARLTTSYEVQDDSVYITLFGLPGNVTSLNPTRLGQPRCSKSTNNTSSNSTIMMMDYETISTKFVMYFQLECHRTNCDTTNHQYHHIHPMEFIPTISIDKNQNNVTFIWNGNLSKFCLHRHDLISQSYTTTTQKVTSSSSSSSSSDNQSRQQQQQQEDHYYVEKSIRLSFWLHPKKSLENDNVNDGTINYRRTMTTTTIEKPFVTIDIPLSTGVVGHAGPQIRNKPRPSDMTGQRKEEDGFTRLMMHPSAVAPSYTAQPPISVSLCVATYGISIQKYLPEFVQHHKNIGFEHIVIGIDTVLDSTELHTVKHILERYIKEGTVVLAATGVPPGIMDCDTDMQKIHFYHSCIYHCKGISKYVGIWDVDEFWLPPPPLPLSNFTTMTHFRKPNNSDPPSNVTSPHEISPLLVDDSLWNQSVYSKSVTVSQAMAIVQAYQQFYGCGDQWCYHAFPSYTIRLRRVGGRFPSRTGILEIDFDLRDMDTNNVWTKSISKTKNVWMGGFHYPGNCIFDNNNNNNVTTTTTTRVWSFNASKVGEVPYHLLPAGKKYRCKNLRMNGFGNIHHFLSLIQMRGGELKPMNETFGIDEYIQYYAATVSAQIATAYYTNYSSTN